MMKLLAGLALLVAVVSGRGFGDLRAKMAPRNMRDMTHRHHMPALPGRGAQHTSLTARVAWSVHACARRVASLGTQ